MPGVHLTARAATCDRKENDGEDGTGRDGTVGVGIDGSEKIPKGGRVCGYRERRGAVCRSFVRTTAMKTCHRTELYRSATKKRTEELSIQGVLPGSRCV